MARAKRVAGYTLDTGVLIALERRRLHVTRVIQKAVGDGIALHIPMAVVVEFWRGPVSRDLRELIDNNVVPDTLERAKLAGIALGKIPKQPRGRGPGPVDALVAALASEMGDVVVTADPDDIVMLRAHLPGIIDVVAV